MIKTFFDFISQYGPFPAGIVFGVWICRWAIKQQLDYMGSEIDSLRKERDKLTEIIYAKENRIMMLHNKKGGK